jgi:hypothetical protein
MKKLLLAAAAVAALATPSYASHWECTVQKDTGGMNRPNGTSLRWGLPSFEKGDVVSIKDTAGRWDFITRSGPSDDPGYGWVPHNVLGNCRAADGT